MRGFVSIMLLVCFVIVAVSGIQMHIPAHGHHSNAILKEAGDNFLLKRLHEWAGYLLIILGMAHLLINRKPMLMYIGWRSRKGKNHDS